MSNQWNVKGQDYYESGNNFQKFKFKNKNKKNRNKSNKPVRGNKRNLEF